MISIKIIQHRSSETDLVFTAFIIVSLISITGTACALYLVSVVILGSCPRHTIEAQVNDEFVIDADAQIYLPAPAG